MTAQSRQPTSLVSLAGSLSKRIDELDLSLGNLTPDWFSFSDLSGQASPVRESLLQYEGEQCPGLDAKGQVAFLVSHSAYYALTAVAALYLAEGVVPSLEPSNLGMRMHEVHWRHGNESGTYQALQLRLASTKCWTYAPRLPIFEANPLTNEKALQDQLSIQIEHLFKPLIKRLHNSHRLSRGAQWRLVADALAMAFLNVGETLEMEEHAKREAMALIRNSARPFYNRQTDYVDIQYDHPATPGKTVTECIRIRGGCCRYYTSTLGTYCNTCVLLKPEEQVVRLKETLRQNALSG